MRWKIIVAISLLAMISASPVFAENGSGMIKIGYTFIDEEGNRAVNHSTFNQYEGFDFSLEKFRYFLKNGIRFDADLKRVTLNNRNLYFGAEKSGLFGVRVNNNQYRRVYDFDGNDFIRRHTTTGDIWLYPYRYVKIFGSGSFIGRSGSVLEYFDVVDGGMPTAVDYEQKRANTGFQINYRGRMLRAEYGGINYVNHEDYYLDQSRRWFKIRGFGAVPRYDWILIHGGFLNYRTWYKQTDFEIKSNKGWGGTTLNLPMNFSVSYNFIFERTASDSDKVGTDNIAHTFYASHLWPGYAGATIGYQNDISDDFDNVIKANSYYFSGWIKPKSYLDFRAEYGFRAEKVDEGSRLLGDEDRNRFKISGKYRHDRYGSIRIRYEIRTRNNDQLGSEVDFDRVAFDWVFLISEYADLTGGYSYSVGDYTNMEQEFEFRDHLVYGDILSHEYYNVQAGAGLVYYRSKRDTDVESIALHFSGRYKLPDSYYFEVKYNVNNFDNFLVNNEYYTANIVEINLTKDLSF